MNKKYIVTLTAEERAELQDMIAVGKRAARTLAHARILLKADVREGEPVWDDAAISQAVEVSAATVQRVRQRFVEEGHRYQCPARLLLLGGTRDEGQDVVGDQVDECRVLGDGLAIVRQGLIVPALLRVHRAQVRQRRREVWLDP